MRRTPSRASSAARRATARRDRPAAAPPPPLPPSHPAGIVTVLVAAGCVVAAVTFRILDTDFWQHLAVGRALWETRGVPHVELWSWPTWGEPAILRSWLFRALLWPFWLAGELNGLFAWRWLTTLAAFGLAWSAARRMGARGLAPLVVLVLAALIYRQRSQVRPETLAAVLLALTLWLLESRRHADPVAPSRRDPVWALVPALWLWANVHISYVIGFVLVAIHLVDAHLAARRGLARAHAPRGLWLAGLAAALVSLVHPYGWRALWQPFEYALRWRDTAIFQGIGELRRVGWSGNETNGAFLLLAAWPLLLLWRARRHGWDVAGSLTCAFFTAYALPSQRFLAAYALAAVPYVGRDLDAWIAARRWPRVTAFPAVRAGIASLACVALAAPELLRPDSPMRPGIGLDLTRYPVAACDVIAAEGIRGRFFNQGRTSGYLLWRFWPDRGRLPFMSIHPEDSPPDIRTLYAAVFSDPAAWDEVDRRFRFDVALLDRRQYGADRLYDRLDAEPGWALVFADDAALLYLRRDGAAADAAARLGLRAVRGGREGLAALRAAWADDDTLRARARAELERLAAASPFHAGASSLLADLAMTEGRFADARPLLERALAVDPATPRAHERLGLVAMWERDPARAIASFERERRRSGPSAALEVSLGFARASQGDVAAARRHFAEALRLEPGHVRARELLRELDAGGGVP